MLKLFNTESREKETVHSQNGVVKMYTCGPTIYDFAHIGNFRTYVFEDVLRRTLLFLGMKVEQAMNLTDIDDKTIRGAIAKGVALKEYTDPFKKAFFEDLEKLKIQKVEHYPEATHFIPQMIEIIEELIEKGYAYKSANGSIYFSIRKFPKYGRLSHLHLEDLQVNASGENEADEYDKDNASDFVLWKAYDKDRDGKIFWQSPFGPGRPGWHIECSAMAMTLLGKTIDIHCGGVDNMFPHHENEIAQSECASDQLFVRHWVHAEHLLVNHKKMSKSLGNFYTLRNLLDKGYSGPEVRYLLLSSHYRTQLNFTFAGLESARSSLSRVKELVFRLRLIEKSLPKRDVLAKANSKFVEALEDDLNMSVALSVLFDLVRELNILCDDDLIGKEEANEVLSLLSSWDEVLAVLPLEEIEEKIPDELYEFLHVREEARKLKDWKKSDEMRDAILSRGYIIEDTPKGARLKKR